MGFPSQDSIQAYLLANPDSALAAVHFIFDNSTAANTLTGFLLQTNTTVRGQRKEGAGEGGERCAVVRHLRRRRLR